MIVKGPEDGVDVSQLLYVSDDGWPSSRPKLSVTYYGPGQEPQATVHGIEQTPGNPNWGGKYLISSRRQKFVGVKSAIKTPSTDFAIPDRTLATSFVGGWDIVSEQLIELGFAQTNNVNFDNCFSRSNLTYYIELGAGGQNSCIWLDRPVDQANIPFRYNFSREFRMNRTFRCLDGGYPDCWRVFIDDYELVPEFRHFRYALWVVALGEINVRAGQPKQRGTTYAGYGCDGKAPWSLGYGVNPTTTTYRTIRRAHPFRGGVGWSVTKLQPAGTFSIANTSSDQVRPRSGC